MAWPPPWGCRVSGILTTELGSAAHCELEISLWRDLLRLVALWAASSVPSRASQGASQFPFARRTEAVGDELNLAPTCVCPQTTNALGPGYSPAQSCLVFPTL